MSCPWSPALTTTIGGSQTLQKLKYSLFLQLSTLPLDIKVCLDCLFNVQLLMPPGITCFIVDKEQGVEIAKKEQKVCVYIDYGKHLRPFSWVSEHHPLVCSTLTTYSSVMTKSWVKSARDSKSILFYCFC